MIGTAADCIRFLTRADSKKLYEVRDYKPNRSLTANNYFHRLVRLLAHGQAERFSVIKNELIRQYGNGELVRDDEGKAVWVLLPDTDDWQKSETEHYVPTSFTDEFRGVTVRAFLRLKGSHTYNSADMAQLIEGTRNECLGSGISMRDIETPEEREMLKALGVKDNAQAD